jgi:hypothetical protein
MAPTNQRFLATIYKIWMMRHVDVPEQIARALVKEFACGDKGATGKPTAKLDKGTPTRGRKEAPPKYIPVFAIVNGRSARVTLVPAGGGRYRIQLNTALRKAARADVGDVVGVELRLDRESRELPVPADLRAALKEHPKARKAFDSFTPGHRRHFIKWFDAAKAPETRIRRMGQAIDFLLERAVPRGQASSRRSRR